MKGGIQRSNQWWKENNEALAEDIKACKIARNKRKAE